MAEDSENKTIVDLITVLQGRAEEDKVQISTQQVFNRTIEFIRKSSRNGYVTYQDLDILWFCYGIAGMRAGGDDATNRKLQHFHQMIKGLQSTLREQIAKDQAERKLQLEETKMQEIEKKQDRILEALAKQAQ